LWGGYTALALDDTTVYVAATDVDDGVAWVLTLPK
jgi:hypothetical protein